MTPRRTQAVPRMPRRHAPAFDWLERRGLLSATPAASNASTHSVAADFNGDGRDDLASVDPSLKVVEIRFSSGAGGFGAPNSIDLGVAPRQVVAGDFNGDGRPDLAVTTPNGLDVLLNRGDGTFLPPVALASGKDFGPIDVVLLNGYRHSTPEDFGPIVVGDFNGDGKLDLALKGYDPIQESLDVAFGNGDGTFRAPTGAPLHHLMDDDLNQSDGLGYLVAGDLNGDGKSAIFESNGSHGPGTSGYYPEVNVFTVGADGSFRYATTIRPDATVGGLASGDLNGDGKADLVVAEGNPGVEVFRNVGGGQFGLGTTLVMNPPGAYNNAPEQIALGDLDADGSLDFLAFGAGAANVRMNRGAGILGDLKSYLVDGAIGSGGLLLHDAQATESAAVGDFNGNGTPDFAFVTASSRPVVSSNEGDGTFPLPDARPIDTQGMFAGDFLGHRKTDLATVTSRGISVVERAGDGTTGPAVVTDFSGITPGQDGAVAAADLNGDGRLDLVEVRPDDSSSPGQAASSVVQVLLNRGDGTFQPSPRYTVAGEVYHIRLVDLDGDGKPDLVMTDIRDGRVFVAPGDGVGGFGTFVSYGLGDFRAVDTPAPEEIAVADVNGDGVPDLLIDDVAHHYASKPYAPSWERFHYDTPAGLTVPLGRGDGTFLHPHFFRSYTGISHLVAADLNGDGRADIAFNTGGGAIFAGYLPTPPAPDPTESFDLLPGSKPGEPYAAERLLGRPDGTFGSPLDLDGNVMIASTVLDGSYLHHALIVYDRGRLPAERIPQLDGTLAPASPLPSGELFSGLPGLAGYFDGVNVLALSSDVGVDAIPLPPTSLTDLGPVTIRTFVTNSLADQPFFAGTIKGPEASWVSSATIDWGDGTTSAGSVKTQPFGPQYVDGPRTAITEVDADHAFNRVGVQTVWVTLTRFDGGVIRIRNRVEVEPRAMYTVSAPQRRIGTVANLFTAAVSFTTTDPTASASDFMATVGWGDGSPDSPEWVEPEGYGQKFIALGLHVYTRAGTYLTRTTIRDRTGQLISANVETVIASATPPADDPTPAPVGEPPTTVLAVPPTPTPVDLPPVVPVIRPSPAIPTPVIQPSPVIRPSPAIPTPTPTPPPPTFVGSVSVGDSVERQGLPSFSAAFATDDAIGSARDVSAAVDWGDGTSSAGTVALSAGPGPLSTVVTVGGGHVYAASGVYNVRVRIADGWGRGGEADGRAFVADVPIALAGRLDPAGDGGMSATDGITDDAQPTFDGTSEPGSEVVVFVVKSGDPAPFVIGRATADEAGRWSIRSVVLADGTYTVAAEATDPEGVTAAGSALSATAWGDVMVVDTAGPRLVGLATDRAAGRIALTFADASDVDPASLLDPSRFLIVGPPSLGAAPVAITGLAWYGPPSSPTVVLSVGDVLAAHPGLYALAAIGGGVADSAGNATGGVLALDDVPAPPASTPRRPHPARDAIGRASSVALAPSLEIPKVTHPGPASERALLANGKAAPGRSPGASRVLDRVRAIPFGRSTAPDRP